MEASWWDEVKNSLLSYLGESEGYSLSAMQLSYDNLPDYLKPCLLYMGMFPEDARIPMMKLISLWTAEGFVQNIGSAEAYLMDLISSNVVMVSKRDYSGKVKICQVHDVVLHFCLEKSREEKFMLAVKGHYIQFQPSEWKESRVRFSFSKELSRFTCVGSKTQKPFHQCLRSVITTNKGYLFPQVITEVRLLKVLDLSSCDVGDLSSSILKPLIHLKYLAVSAYTFDFHPKPHLPHLETLIVNLDEISVIPASFWKMEKLRHVDIGLAEFDLEEDKQGIFEGSSKLENLRILRNIRFPIGEAHRVDVLLRRFPNLQQLEIFFMGNKYCVESFCLKLECLTQLQKLRLSFEVRLLGLHLHSNFKKLVLSGIDLDSTISVIAGLQSLEYLQLHEPSTSRDWWVGNITFHKLKFLKLVKLGISRWYASEESFPLLETLVIKWCFKLEEIPLSFADIPTPKQIKLIQYCGKNKSLEDSAVRIKEEVIDIEGCDRIEVIAQGWGRNIRRL